MRVNPFSGSSNDTCAARYDEAWLNYQQEVALHHTHAKKNRTDNVDAAAEPHSTTLPDCLHLPSTSRMQFFVDLRRRIRIQVA